MSKRWNKRSQAEKERLHEEKQAQERARESKKNGRHYAELEENMDSHRAVTVYNAGDIPIPCPDHGWVGSDKYLVVKEPDLLGRRNLFIYGNCRKCGKRTKRAFPIPVSQEALLFHAAMLRLVREGRVVDRR